MKNFFVFIFLLFILLIITDSSSGLSSKTSIKEKALTKPDNQQWILLNGTWQMAVGKNLQQLPSDGWRDFEVPGKEYSIGVGEPSYIWVRRQIGIPLSWQNNRIFVRFNSSRFNPHVYIDGELIKQRMDGWTPFEVEITSAVKPGSTYWLQLRCQDKSATFSEGFILEPNQSEEALRGKILAPVGGYSMFFGPLDDVWLFSRPNVYLDDIVIIPSTRKNSLTVSGILPDSIADNLWVEGKVLDKDETVLEIPASSVSQSKWEIFSAFANAKYWSPESPHLYKLQLILRKGKQGQIIDTLEERFGFKEFWTDGPDFYLNGVKRHLLASGCWQIATVESYEKIREKLESVKAANIVAFRYHTEPWPKRWVDIADEVGVMIIDEAAVYTDQVGMYAYNDERFWENYRQHLEGLIKRDRNNASVIMWSLENELLHMRMNRYSEDLPKKLGDLGRFVKELDPYHPIIFSGDMDPDGAADVVGLHYPHEIPQNYDWPNTANWLTKMTQFGGSGGMLGVTRYDFYWDRKKPLYIGEYLWVPQQDYSSGTIFFGDTAYTNKDRYHNKAKLQAWIDQTIAYRRAGLSGMCPWSCFRHGVIIDELTRPFYEAQTKLYQPIVAFLQNKDTRFFSGNFIERTFDVFNDSPSEVNLSLKWKLSDTKIGGEEKFSLEPGGYKLVSVSFIAPDVNNPTKFEFQSELIANGTQVNTIKEKYTIEKLQSITAPAGISVLLYDPRDVFHKKIPLAKRIDSLNSLKEVNVDSNLLIIAPQITEIETDTNIQIGKSTFNSKGLLEFLKKGGKVIVLEQETLDGFGLGLLLAEKASTMTFALNDKHPVLVGLSEEDLKFWKSDNYVTNYEIIRPITYGARAITVSGGDKALDQSPIMEFSIEKGALLLIQALVGQKLDIEPSARRILQNSINYLATKKTNENNVAVFNSDAKFTKVLSELGLNYTELKGLLNNEKLDNVDILILHGGYREIIQSKNAIEKFLKSSSSKTIYWHCPDKDTFEELKDMIGADSFEISSSQGPVSIALRENKFLNGVSREDLLFFAESPRGWQREITIDPYIVDKTIMPRKTSTNNQTIEAETLKITGNSFSIDTNTETIYFEAKGTAAGYITVPESGIYMMSLTAGGKETRGSYPLVIIKVADEIVGQINLVQDQIREYPFLAELPAGNNELEISFVNGSDWGGGRELTLDSLAIGEKVSISENVEFLTLPAALVSISVGKSRVIIDNIRWNDNAQNLIKGFRYASALLANLGASFKVQEKGDATWLDIEKFELVGESPYFEKTSDQISFRTNGTVTAQFSCANETEYTMFIRGYSTPVKDEYALVEILIDKKLVGQKEIANNASKEFEIGTTRISEGQHNVSIKFVNDLTADGEDRNLFIDGLGFREK